MNTGAAMVQRTDFWCEINQNTQWNSLQFSFFPPNQKQYTSVRQLIQAIDASGESECGGKHLWTYTNGKRIFLKGTHTHTIFNCTSHNTHTHKTWRMYWGALAVPFQIVTWMSHCEWHLYNKNYNISSSIIKQCRRHTERVKKSTATSMKSRMQNGTILLYRYESIKFPHRFITWTNFKRNLSQQMRHWAENNDFFFIWNSKMMMLPLWKALACVNFFDFDHIQLHKVSFFQ